MKITDPRILWLVESLDVNFSNSEIIRAIRERLYVTPDRNTKPFRFACYRFAILCHENRKNTV